MQISEQMATALPSWVSFELESLLAPSAVLSTRILLARGRCFASHEAHCPSACSWLYTVSTLFRSQGRSSSNPLLRASSRPAATRQCSMAMVISSRMSTSLPHRSERNRLKVSITGPCVEFASGIQAKGTVSERTLNAPRVKNQDGSRYRPDDAHWRYPVKLRIVRSLRNSCRRPGERRSATRKDQMAGYKVPDANMYQRGPDKLQTAWSRVP